MRKKVSEEEIEQNKKKIDQQGRAESSEGKGGERKDRETEKRKGREKEEAWWGSMKEKGTYQKKEQEKKRGEKRKGQENYIK